MQKWIVSILVLVCATFIGCADRNSMAAAAAAPAAQAEPVSWRFAGLDAIKAKTNLVVLREVTSLPDFEGMRAGLAERLAATIALKAAGATNDELAKLLRPVAEDLISFPSIFEQTGQGPSNVCALAVEIPAERHEVWKSNWEPISKFVKIPGAKLSREGKWTLVSNGPTKPVLDRAAKPFADVLEFTGPGNLLQKLLPTQTPQKVSLRVSTQGASLRSEGKATFAADLKLNLQPWKIPVNTIRDPIVGITAIQGFVREHLTGWGPFKKHAAPEQLFIWNDGRTPFSIYAAAPVGDPAAVVKDFVMGIDLAQSKITGSLEFNTNKSQLLLKSLPIAVPFLSPAHENDKGFLLAGLMPMTFGPKPIPDELVKEITSRTNLVYYEWEFTSSRLEQIQPSAQIYNMAIGGIVPMFNRPAEKWLHAAKLGNAVTEITQTGPSELKLTRGSDIGLTAIELFNIASWISGPPPAGSKPLRMPGAPAGR